MTVKVCRVCEQLFQDGTDDRVGVCPSCNKNLELEKIWAGIPTPKDLDKYRDSYKL